MEAVSAFFMRNIVYVYFFYGLAFFAMGLVVYLESGRATEFRFARALTPLALFGFLHGTHEWFEMFQIFAAHEAGRTASTAEELFRTGLLVLSFLCLLAFGTRLLPEAEHQRYSSLWQVIAFGLAWAAGLAWVQWRHHPSVPELLSAADVLARYSLGITGALLACWALLRERRDFHARGMSGYGQDLLWAALAFFIYGVVGQVFTRPSLVFPSQTINTAFFLRAFGIPVQLLRTVAAVAIAISLSRALRAFELESRLRLARANKARIEAQAAALQAQSAALEAQQRRADEIEALNRQLHATAAELGAMVELARILTSTVDMRRLLRDALYQIVHSFARGCCGALFLCQPDGQLQLAGEYRRPAASAAAPPLPLEAIAAQAVAAGSPVGAASGGTPRSLEEGELANGWTFRLLAVPLRTKDKTLGGLVLSSRTDEEPLGREELKLLMAFGQQLATVIENVQLYGVLREREAQLADLVRRLVSAQEEERQRIARELHDETGQQLTALAMGLGAIEAALVSHPERAAMQVRNLREVADQAITELRNIMSDLRPSQLDDLGLVPALRWYVMQFAARHPELAVTFDADRMADRLPPQHETVLFRAAQEALANVARHAHATSVQVSLSQESGGSAGAGGMVCLEVVDNGVGFDLNAPPKHELGSGLGLPGMRERVALVKGEVAIESQPGRGTRVRVRLPRA